MENELDQLPQSYEVPDALARKGLSDKIAAQEELMKTSQQADEYGHSAHFDMRNILAEALDDFNEVAQEAGGDHEKLHSLISQKIEECVSALAAHKEPDELAILHGADEQARLRWSQEQKILEHNLKIWETVRDEAFPRG